MDSTTILFGIRGPSMGFAEAFYEYLDSHNSKRGWQAEFIRRSGISQSAFNKVLKRATKDPGLAIVGAIVDAIGDEFFEPLLSYTPSRSESARALKERISVLERENSLLRELVDALKENRALEKSSGDRGAQEIGELSSGAERRALPSVEE